MNGEWIDAEGRAAFDVTDPATGEVIGQVPDLGVEDAQAAIEAASAAMPAWAATTAKERAAVSLCSALPRHTTGSQQLRALTAGRGSARRRCHRC